VAETGKARRYLGQRRVLGGAPGACFDRGPRPQAAGLCRAHHAGRTRRPRQSAGSADQAAVIAIIGGAKVSTKIDLSGNLGHQGRRAGDRRRHGQYLPACCRASASASRWLRKTSPPPRCGSSTRQTPANCAIILPVDAVVAFHFAANSPSHAYGLDAIPPEGMILDGRPANRSREFHARSTTPRHWSGTARSAPSR